MKVRARFAPSPTGTLHVGNARSALFNYLFARHHNGVNILRIEDTDKERSTAESEKTLIEALHWLGLDWDEGPDKGGDHGPYRQSERRDLYREHAERLVEEGRAFYCYCSEEELEEKRQKAIEEGRMPHYDGHCRHLTDDQRKAYEAEGRKPVIRFHVDSAREYAFLDRIHGRVDMGGGTVGDFVLLRSDGLPVYNYACVIDDHLMDVTHVFRGDDHLYNTLRQLMIYEAFSWEAPEFAHLPMILAADRSKLSKRSGAKFTFVNEFREAGYLVEALINYLSLLGWSPENGEELMTMEQLKKWFDDSRINASPAVFDLDKLTWMNGKYIREICEETYLERLKPFYEKYFSTDEDTYKKAALFIRPKLETLDDVGIMLKGLVHDTDGSLDFDFSDEAVEMFNELEGGMLISKAMEYIRDRGAQDFAALLGFLKTEAGAKGKKLYMPLRLAVTGHEHGPDLGGIFGLLGDEEVLRRMNRFLERA